MSKMCYCKHPIGTDYCSYGKCRHKIEAHFFAPETDKERADRLQFMLDEIMLRRSNEK